MKTSEKTLKWIMRFYPPLFFQRIWVVKFYPEFRAVDVKVSSSLLNRNYNGSIFGGTIFSAVDPFYPILLDQIFKQKGFKTVVWLKSAQIKYVKPARSTLRYTVKITEDEIEAVHQNLKTIGKSVKTFHLELYNRNQEICALIDSEVYIRDLKFKE